MIFFDIDTQRDFMSVDGALYVPSAEDILPNIEQLLGAASEHRILTISSECAHEENDPEFTVFPPHCLKGTRGAERIFATLPALPRLEIEVDAVFAPARRLTPATHYIVKKKVYDLFSNPWLESLRCGNAFQDKQCVVFGVATEYCVRAAGLGLAAAQANVQLVTDAICGIKPKTTMYALDEMRAAGVEFTTTEKVLKAVN